MIIHTHPSLLRIPLCILISSNILFHNDCFSKDINLPKAGLVISLPLQWMQIPDEDLQGLIQQTRAKAPKINTPSYVYGFRKMPEVPLATIVINVRAGKMPQAELDKIPTSSGTNTYAKEYAKDVERRSLGFLKDMKLGEPTYDRQHGIIWMKMSIGDVMGNGGMKGLSAVIIGEEREVQLTGYCDDAIFESFCPEFEDIVASARMTKTNGELSKSIDRAALPLERAILGDWAVCFEGKQTSFTHRLYEDGTYTMSNSKKTTVLQYRVVRKDEADRTIVLQISNKESGKGHQKTFRFSSDKRQAHETILMEMEQGKNSTIETTWALISSPPPAAIAHPSDEKPSAANINIAEHHVNSSEQHSAATTQLNKQLESAYAQIEELKKKLEAAERMIPGDNGIVTQPSPSNPLEVCIGDPVSKVIRLKGQPESVQKNGEKDIFNYDNCTIIFQKGIVEKSVALSFTEIQARVKLADQAKEKSAKQAWRQLTIGMGKNKVRALLGEPKRINNFGTWETWDYENNFRSGSVRFDEHGRTDQWSEPF